MALSPDGKAIACANIENHRLNLWETATGKEKVAAEKATVSLKGYSSLIGAAAMNPDGTVWAEAGGHYGSEGLPGAGEVKLWDVTTGRERATFKGAVKLQVALHQLSYLHKGEGVPKRVLLKVANLNGMECQTDDVDKELRQALEKILDENQRDKYLKVLLRQLGTTSHEGPEVVPSVAFSPDGKTLASASVLGTVLLWDVKSGKRVGTFQRFNPSGRDEDLNPAYCVSFSPDGKTLAAGTMHGIKLWDVGSGQRLVALSDPPGAVWSVAFSPDGKRVATSGSKRLLVPKNDIGTDPTVRLWEWLRAGKADR